jgi:transposase IS204/IS1001/IS1096/IS1165 family protein
MHRTQRLTKFIAHSFHNVITIKEASDKANVSTHTVYKILGTLNNSSDRIGEAISIDEFKGNAGTEKYQTIVVDPIKHKVLDILYSRKSVCLVEYFKSLDKSKRMNVKYFSCDMNKTFIDMAKTYFPNAKIVVDRYHFIRQVYWALENVRKNVQKSMSKTLRRYYKRSRHIITARKSNLSEENKAALNLMLEYSEDLRKAHFIKELFIKLLDEKSYSKQRVLLREWLLEVESSGIKEFNAAITAFRNNYKYILNSLKYRHISNGPTEGFNNKIKVLKRISYGVRNFTYFRNRILMATA